MGMGAPLRRIFHLMSFLSTKTKMACPTLGKKWRAVLMASASIQTIRMMRRMTRIEMGVRTPKSGRRAPTHLSTRARVRPCCSHRLTESEVGTLTRNW